MINPHYAYIVFDPDGNIHKVFSSKYYAESYVHSIIKGYRHKETDPEEISFWLDTEKKKRWIIQKHLLNSREAEKQI